MSGPGDAIAVKLNLVAKPMFATIGPRVLLIP